MSTVHKMSAPQELVQVDLHEGQYCDYEQYGRPRSKVITIDQNNLTAVDETEKSWLSYTLLTKNDPQNQQRWWIANFPNIGAHFCVAATKRDYEPTAALKSLSGDIEVYSEGDLSFSKGKAWIKGKLTTWVQPDGTLYMEEVFPGIEEPLIFQASPYRR